MHQFILLCMLFASFAPALYASEPRREPWEWTVDERIAERCDRAAARGRVDRDRARGLGPTAVKDGKVVPFELKDVIRGRQAPHLMLPTELFEAVVRNGFLREGWRETFATRITEAGLPASFWEQLESLSAAYLADLRELEQIGRMTDRTAAIALRQSLEVRLCVNRADALARARQTFGSRFDIFLYREVAPTKSLQISHVEDPDKLRWREGGCR